MKANKQTGVDVGVGSGVVDVGVGAGELVVGVGGVDVGVGTGVVVVGVGGVDVGVGTGVQPAADVQLALQSTHTDISTSAAGYSIGNATAQT